MRERARVLAQGGGEKIETARRPRLGRGLFLQVIEFRREAYPTALLVVGFPSHGLVGGIAAQYLIETLQMDLVAALHSDRFPPTVAVVDGVAVSPVQVWAGAERCGLDGECEQLLVVKSDIAPAAELYVPMAEAILRWAKGRGVRLGVVLEGVSSLEAEGDFVNVAGLVSPGARGLLGRKAFDVLEEARLVSGASAAFLAKATEVGVPVLALFTNASPQYPDAKAAAKLLTAMDPLVPHVTIDPEPLRERAERIEAVMKEDLAKQQREMEKLQPYGASMYA